ncbi:MAG: hypothetical protein LBP72_05160 [Dysgonamonadaceae bacterium]|jgi:uncharacterized membrane protein|nr:hypothetical protein [Dysgonamonadaceae bacterium]
MNTSHYIYEEEAEKASYAYLMSTIIVIIGLPMPIINVIASVMFYVANRRKTYFIRFHCLQSMLSQLSVVPLNSIGVGWTISILTGYSQLSNLYIAYIITIFGFNVVEFIASLYAAVRVRKKVDVRFWIFGPMTELFCKNSPRNDTHF